MKRNEDKNGILNYLTSQMPCCTVTEGCVPFIGFIS